MRLACAPNVAPKDADRDIRSLTTIEVILSSCTPPYSSGASTPRKPSAPRAPHQIARQAPVFLLELVEGRQHFVAHEVAHGLCDQPVLFAQLFRREDARGVRRLQQPLTAAQRRNRRRESSSSMPRFLVP